MQADGLSLLKSIFLKSQAENFRDFESEHGLLFNENWLLFPQMRFVAPQLLTSAIVEESSKFIRINAIEPYGRYILEDAHHERRSTPELSTFPKKEGKYGHVQVIHRPSPENGLPKLQISSRNCDLLIVSSHRLDEKSVNLGAHTTHFEPLTTTRIFLDKQSVQKAYDLFKKEDIEEASTMPCFYQLKQVRSKFDKLSTYSRCRVSSDFASPLELQPCTIWTLADDYTTNPELSQERSASVVFQKIAVEVFRHGESAVIKSSELSSGASVKKGCGVEALINKIKNLGETTKNYWKQAIEQHLNGFGKESYVEHKKEERQKD